MAFLILHTSKTDDILQCNGMLNNLLRTTLPVYIIQSIKTLLLKPPKISAVRHRDKIVMNVDVIHIGSLLNCNKRNISLSHRYLLEM
ncbi:hypothetical protein SK128_017006 [Halocaridina rubra]|uniref:Uncharacterized protein n=1 Tax=Halocaridina rubra TaxID=373956 RepID=A0AAN8X358_HALRR